MHIMSFSGRAVLYLMDGETSLVSEPRLGVAACNDAAASLDLLDKHNDAREEKCVAVLLGRFSNTTAKYSNAHTSLHCNVVL